MLERTPIELVDDPRIAALRGRITFAEALQDAPSPQECAARLESDPSDSDARYRLAAHQVASRDYESALENLLTLMQRDRSWGDDAARKAILMIFDLLGGTGELVNRYRTKLSRTLY
jgi:putative thioredoxin